MTERPAPVFTDAAYAFPNRGQMMHILNVQRTRHTRLLRLMRLLLASGYLFALSAIVSLARASSNRSALAAQVQQQRAQHEEEKKYLEDRLAELESALKKGPIEEETAERRIEQLRQLALEETKSLREALEQTRQQRAELQDKLLRYQQSDDEEATKEVISSPTDSEMAKEELKAGKRLSLSESTMPEEERKTDKGFKKFLKPKDRERTKAEKERKKQEKEREKQKFEPPKLQRRSEGKGSEGK